MAFIQPLLFRLLGGKRKLISLAHRVVFLAHMGFLQNGMHSAWLHSSRDERRRAQIICISLYLDCPADFFFFWDDLWLAFDNTAYLLPSTKPVRESMEDVASRTRRLYVHACSSQSD